MDGFQRQPGVLRVAGARVWLAWLVAAVGLVAASGASCPQMARQMAGVPRVLPPGAGLQQVIDVVNGNSRQVQSFLADQATIQLPNAPRLRANIAMQRPERFRLIGETALSAGPEVDLGSNPERFWFWYRRDPQQAVYHCRHDQFDQSQARQMLPITPGDLVEALGLVEFDPNLPHQGPVPRPDGLLEIRTIRETPQGPTTRVVLVDPTYGWVVGQHLYDAQNRRLASVTASGHRRDPLSNLVMPRAVEINCPATQDRPPFSLRIDLGNVAINTLGPDREGLWAMPAFPNARPVDLADPRVQFLPAGTSGASGR